MLPDTTPLTSPKGGGLYIIRLSPKHFYGGRTQDFQERWRLHLWALTRKRHKSRYMQAVFNRHGMFEPEVLISLESEGEQILAEQRWLDEHHGTDGCVNLTKSAKSGMARGSTHSEATRALISLKGRGRKLSVATRQAIGDAHRGKKVGPHSPETRQKISEALKGRPLTEAHREAISESLKGVGHPCAPETRAHLSAIGKGRVLTLAHRKAISEGNKGKTLSPEHVEILRECNRGRVWTEEMRKKHSEVHMGHVRSEESIQKQKETFHSRPENIEKARASIAANRLPVGTPRTPEHCAAISEGLTGKAQKPEHVAARAAANTGRKNTPETLQKMSESAKKRVALAAMKRLTDVP